MAATGRFELRAKPEDLARWRERANQHGCTLSELIRQALDDPHPGITITHTTTGPDDAPPTQQPARRLIPTLRNIEHNPPTTNSNDPDNDTGAVGGLGAGGAREF